MDRIEAIREKERTTVGREAVVALVEAIVWPSSEVPPARGITAML
jgi:hypothetical protein